MPFVFKRKGMNFIEVMEILRAVSAIQTKSSVELPKFRIYDNQSEGYILLVKAQLINAEYRNHIETIADSCNLNIRESEGYLIIYGS